MTSTAKFTAHVDHEGFIMTRDAHAGICGPFVTREGVVTREAAESVIAECGFVPVGEWEVCWTFAGPTAQVEVVGAPVGTPQAQNVIDWARKTVGR